MLGLHLGMSGRVLVDGEAAGDPLLYASNRADPAWHRFGVTFADGGSMFLRDPRRLGAVELDPDEDRLGPDAFALTLASCARSCAKSRAPVKAVIMDQSRDRRPRQPAVRRGAVARRHRPRPRRRTTCADDEVKRLHRAIRDTLRILGRAGRLAHRRPHVGPRARAALPEGRRARCCAAPSAAARPTRARVHQLSDSRNDLHRGAVDRS